jgi:hypothetical protein
MGQELKFSKRKRAAESRIPGESEDVATETNKGEQNEQE